MKAIIACLALFVAYPVVGQVGKRLTVISTTGANLRSKPNLQSNIIKALPWGTKVLVTEVVSQERENLGIYHISEEEWQGEKFIDTTYLLGKWVKVKHGKATGYLFDSFLLEVQEDQKATKSGYALLFERYNCFYNLSFDPSWHWYGLYVSGERESLREVSISCVKETEEELGDFLGTYTHDRAVSHFIVGSKKPLDVARFNQAAGDYSLPFHDAESIASSRQKAEALGLKMELVKGVGFDNYPIEFCKLYVLGENGLEQSLKLKDDNKGEWRLSNLTWAGDLDGDGKNDYIVHYGEVSAVTVLYLSSAAKKGQVVGEVARWYSGYCC